MGTLFAISLAIIAYTYAGYPALLWLASRLFSRPVKKAEIYPSVTILLSAFNEAKTIEARINNLLSLDYPQDKLEIIVGSDGSTDDTYQIIKRFGDEKKIRYIVSFQRIGKPAMINRMAKEARGEIFVFADARQRFEPNALKEIVWCFADENVGAVSGELIMEDKETGTGKGIGAYWAYEKSLRKMESCIGSMLGATGAIYAVRQSLFMYLPENVLLDDLFTPMNAIVRGKRAIFEPAAKAYDVVAQTTEKEFQRKVRTLAGNFQIFALFPGAFNPFSSHISVQLFSHKFLRLLVPYFLTALFVSNFFLMHEGDFYSLAFFLQVIFYSLALLGFLSEGVSDKIKGAARLFWVPYEFCVLNLAAVVAFFVFLFGRMDVKWKK